MQPLNWFDMVLAELILTNFLLGLLSVFSPCLFPLLPSYIAVTLKENQGRLTIFLSSIFLMLGLMTVFVFIGFISQFIGEFLLSNYNLFARIQGMIIIIAGIIIIRPPNFISSFSLPSQFQDWLYNEETILKRPYLYNFILGLLFTLIAAPCAAGFFILSWNTLLEVDSFSSKLLLIFGFTLGVGLPFIFMSLFVPQVRAELVNKMHSATNKISIVLGIILIIIGSLLILDLSPINIGI